MIRSCRYRVCASVVRFILAASLLVLVPLASAPSPSGIEQHEDAFLTGYSEGNQRLCHERLEQMLLENPAHPVSVLYYPYLLRLADIIGPAAVCKTADKIREALDRSGEEKAGAALLRLNCMIEKLRYRLDGEKAKLATDALNPVRRWALFGPYNRYGPGDIDQRFEPEIITGGTPVYPQQNVIVTNYDGWLDPGRYLFPARGVVYARVSFYAEGSVKIRVCSDSIYRVFINGMAAIKNTPAERRSVRVIRITRAAGVTVLVKLWGDPMQKLRLLITNDADRSINPMREDDRTFSGECGIEEEPEYPGSAVMAENGQRGDLHRGMYFDGLGSSEAVPWYRKAIVREQSGHVLFLLESALLGGYDTHAGSARAEEARRMCDRIHSDYPAYVPARHGRLKLLIDSGEYSEAYREGKKALSDVSLDIHSCLAFAGLLDTLGHDREFRETAARIRKEYPDSPLLLDREAGFFSGRNSEARMEVLGELLKISFSAECARSLIREQMARGEYEKAMKTIHSHNYNNDFTGELVSLLLKKGDYGEARTVIFKALIQGDRPDLYHSLGLIDVLQSDDPTMYFQKLLDKDPSQFSIDEYVRYFSSGVLENPFNRYCDSAGIAALGTGADSSRTRSPADVLYHGRIILLNKDGSNRGYYEEIVRVNDESGARRWMSVKLPVHGEFRPVRVRVYGINGEQADDYSVIRTNDGSCLHIKPVRKDSILHLSYIIENGAPGGGFFSMGPVYLQQYDEPVKRASFTVIAPDGLKLYFLVSKGMRVEEARAGSMRTYSVGLNELTPVKPGPFSAGIQTGLPAVSFSTMGGPEDFIAWYNGLLLMACRPLEAEVGRFAGESVEQTVGSVYEFASKEIVLEQGGFGSPVPSEDTLFRKKGSTEDKVLLARVLLERLGIRSFIAFARNKHLPDPGVVGHAEYFTSILLYVPLDAGRALWLDFSSPGFRCGVTDEAITGTDAMVIVNNVHHKKKVMSGGSPAMK